MLQSKQRIQWKQGKNALGRFEYLQQLVLEFQETSNLKAQQQILANLGNFAYDPVNYEHLRVLNVIPDLFLDALTEENAMLVRYGVGGVSNSCADPVNARLYLENDIFDSICPLLRSTDDETVENALSVLIFMSDFTNIKNLSIKEQVTLLSTNAKNQIKNLSLILLESLKEHEQETD